MNVKPYVQRGKAAVGGGSGFGAQEHLTHLIKIDNEQRLLLVYIFDDAFWSENQQRIRVRCAPEEGANGRPPPREDSPGRGRQPLAHLGNDHWWCIRHLCQPSLITD